MADYAPASSCAVLEVDALVGHLGKSRLVARLCYAWLANLFVLVRC